MGFGNIVRRGALVALVALAGMGCGDETSPVGGGAPTGGANLANRPIDATNAALVYAAANTAVTNAIAAVFQQAAKKPATPPALAKSLSATVNGKNSGKVSAGGDYSAGPPVKMTCKMTFDNFSDDGKLFIGGTVDVSYSLPNATSPAAVKYSYRSTLSFAGDYKGTMDFDIAYDAGRVSGSYTAAGRTVRF